MPCGEFALTNPQSFLRCYFAWKQEVWLQMCAVLSGSLCPRLGISIPPFNLLLSNPLSCLVCVCSPSFLIPLFLDHCRYNEVFLIVDTCQAYSMTLKLYSPNILGVGSSLVGEDSLSVSSSLCTGTLINSGWLFLLGLEPRISASKNDT